MRDLGARHRAAVNLERCCADHLSAGGVDQSGPARGQGGLLGSWGNLYLDLDA
jgi:hypothetical protein